MTAGLGFVFDISDAFELFVVVLKATTLDRMVVSARATKVRLNRPDGVSVNFDTVDSTTWALVCRISPPRGMATASGDMPRSAVVVIAHCCGGPWCGKVRRRAKFLAVNEEGVQDDDANADAKQLEQYSCAISLSIQETRSA
jgi:hypothetical protein